MAEQLKTTKADLKRELLIRYPEPTMDMLEVINVIEARAFATRGTYEAYSDFLDLNIEARP
jgi:hypothetical protein